MPKLCVRGTNNKTYKIDLGGDSTEGGEAYQDENFRIIIKHASGLKEVYGTVKTIAASIGSNMFQKSVTFPDDLFSKTPIMFGNSLGNSGQVNFNDITISSFKVGCIQDGGENANRQYGREAWVSYHAIGF